MTPNGPERLIIGQAWPKMPIIDQIWPFSSKNHNLLRKKQNFWYTHIKEPIGHLFRVENIDNYFINWTHQNISFGSWVTAILASAKKNFFYKSLWDWQWLHNVHNDNSPSALRTRAGLFWFHLRILFYPILLPNTFLNSGEQFVPISYSRFFFSFLFSTGLFTAIIGLKLLKIDTRVLSPSRLYQALTGEGHFIQLLFRIEDLPFSPAVRSAFLDIEKEAKRRKTWGTADVWSKSSKAYHGPSWNARTWWVWWV